MHSLSLWQVTREYQEHCEAIEAKIVGVMSDTLERQLASWEARSPVPSPAFTGILKAITKLHEAISGVLSPQQVFVFSFFRIMNGEYFSPYCCLLQSLVWI